MTVPSVAAPSFVPNISYRFDTDFEPVIKASVSYNVLVVNPSRARNLGRRAGRAAEKPARQAHIFVRRLRHTGSSDRRRVLNCSLVRARSTCPIAQFPQAIGDLLNGTNAFMFITMLPVVDLIKTGKLRALAVTGPKRVPVLPDVPTIVEAGFPSLVVEDWVGFAVKHGAPSETVALLNRAINKALEKPSVRDAFAKIGAEPVGGSPEEFGQFVKSQVGHWRKVVADAGIKVQP